MDANSWTYAAIGVLILTALVGAGVSGYLFWLIYKRGRTPHVVVIWLLMVIAGMSLAQLLEQTRVLLFRLSYDGVISESIFFQLYASTPFTLTSKLLFAVALAAGTGLKLALYCERDDHEAAQFAIGSAGAVLVLWLLAASAITWIW